MTCALLALYDYLVDPGSLNTLMVYLFVDTYVRLIVPQVLSPLPDMPTEYSRTVEGPVRRRLLSTNVYVLRVVVSPPISMLPCLPVRYPIAQLGKKRRNYKLLWGKYHQTYVDQPHLKGDFGVHPPSNRKTIVFTLCCCCCFKDVL